MEAQGENLRTDADTQITESLPQVVGSSYPRQESDSNEGHHWLTFNVCGHAASTFMKLAKSLCWTQVNKKTSNSEIQEFSLCCSRPVVGSSKCHVKENRSKADTNDSWTTTPKPISYCLQPFMVTKNDHLRTHHWWNTDACNTCNRSRQSRLKSKSPQWSKQVAKTLPREMLATPWIEYNENEPNLEMEMALRKTSFIWAKWSWEFLLVYHQTISTKSSNEYKV